jgi:hypothetical protein
VLLHGGDCDEGSGNWRAAALRRCVACGLTLELRRPVRRAGLAVGPMMNQGGPAAKLACRAGSPLERRVRPHLAA